MKTKLIGLMVVLVLLLGSYGSVSAAPVDDEFRVNTYTDSHQSTPAVAMDASGNFVITWHSYGQDSSGYGVYAQRYDRTGNPLGSEFQVNTCTTSHQYTPAVAMDASGNFVITWASHQDGYGYGVYAQRYDRRGNVLGPEFQVNSYTDDHQRFPAVAMDASGNFVITWYSDQEVGTGIDYDVYAQRYDRTGNRLGSEFQVNTCTTDNQYTPAVAMDASGNFVIIWHSYKQDRSGYGVYARRYDRRGNVLGPEFQVNTCTTNDQQWPAVAMDASGNFVITWHSYQQDSSGRGVYAQRYDRRGNPLCPEFQVNTCTIDHQSAPAVAMDASGNFVITWESNGQDSSGYGVYAQRYDRRGNPLGLEFRVNTWTIDHPFASAVAMDASGNFVITWNSYGQDGSRYGVYAQRYDRTVTP